jgi:hypothetical protein
MPNLKVVSKTEHRSVPLVSGWIVNHTTGVTIEAYNVLVFGKQAVNADTFEKLEMGKNFFHSREAAIENLISYWKQQIAGIESKVFHAATFLEKLKEIK